MALRAVLRRTTALDRMVVLSLLGLSAASFGLLGLVERGGQVVVERDGKVLFRAPIDEARTVSLSGPLGETVLEIEGGHACVLSSPCPLKVCMGMGRISRAGELLACVPNRLVVSIEGGEEPKERGYDLLSR